MKKLISVLLVLALLLPLCACGDKAPSGFKTLETLSEREYGLICRKDSRVSPVIRAALDVLAANGTLRVISNQWLGRDAIIMDGNAKALDEFELEDAEETTLIVGVDSSFQPMAFQQYGQYVGMNVDIAKALGELVGWNVVFQPISSADVGAQLSSGNIDCALGFDPALVDQEKYDCSAAYMTSNLVLAVRSGSDVKRLKDLKGLRVGTVDDPLVEKALRTNEKVTKYAAGATVYLSPERCVDALDHGWCAAIAMDSLRLAYTK